MLINLLINNEEVDRASFYCYRQYAMVFVLTITEANSALKWHNYLFRTYCLCCGILCNLSHDDDFAANVSPRH